MAQLPTGPLRRPQQHEEIADYLRDEIFAGHIPAGESLPSEVELCEQFNTSRGPVRQAVATLRAEGLLSSGRGRRSLVLSNTRTETFEEILSTTSWLYRMGKNPGEVVNRRGIIQADETVAEKMRITPGTDVYVLDRVRSAEAARRRDHLDLVRDLEVESTPTVLVLDDGGRIVRRAVGLPRRADVISALGEAIR